MKYDEAFAIATYWKKKLQPFCDRIEIAGSIRRLKPEVKDIEIVCIPKVITHTDLFEGKQTMRHPGFAQTLQDPELLLWIKGDAHKGRYTQVKVIQHQVNIDCFMATVDNWGHILAIRTGSGDYSHKVLANGWCKAGYHSEDGQLTRDSDNKPVPVREEQDLFQLIGIPYVEPQFRQYP